MSEFLTLGDQPGDSRWSEQDLARFRQEFALRRQKHFMVLVPSVVILFFISIVLKSDTQHLLGPPGLWIGIALVMVAGLLVFTIWNLSCPACGASWGKDWLGKTACPGCGVTLR